MWVHTAYTVHSLSNNTHTARTYNINTTIVWLLIGKVNSIYFAVHFQSNDCINWVHAQQLDLHNRLYSANWMGYILTAHYPNRKCINESISHRKQKSTFKVNNNFRLKIANLLLSEFEEEYLSFIFLIYTIFNIHIHVYNHLIGIVNTKYAHGFEQKLALFFKLISRYFFV